MKIAAVIAACFALGVCWEDVRPGGQWDWVLLTLIVFVLWVLAGVCVALIFPKERRP